MGKAGEGEEVGSVESVPEEEVEAVDSVGIVEAVDSVGIVEAVDSVGIVEAVDSVGIVPKAEGMERVFVGMVLVGGVQVRVGGVGERAAVGELVGGWSSAGGW